MQAHEESHPVRISGVLRRAISSTRNARRSGEMAATAIPWYRFRVTNPTHRGESGSPVANRSPLERNRCVDYRRRFAGRSVARAGTSYPASWIACRTSSSVPSTAAITTVPVS